MGKLLPIRLKQPNAPIPRNRCLIVLKMSHFVPLQVKNHLRGLPFPDSPICLGPYQWYLKTFLSDHDFVNSIGFPCAFLRRRPCVVRCPCLGWRRKWARQKHLPKRVVLIFAGGEDLSCGKLLAADGGKILQQRSTPSRFQRRNLLGFGFSPSRFRFGLETSRYPAGLLIRVNSKKLEPTGVMEVIFRSPDVLESTLKVGAETVLKCTPPYVPSY